MSGTVSFQLNNGFAAKWQARFERAQQTLAQETLRRCEPYIPLRTGRLLRSGTAGKDGTVRWSAPYARSQYYSARKPGQAASQRGPFWFQRMKAAHGAEIVAAAKRSAGGST